ncbi:metal ABC transporter ATP-binding protein [Prochlorococcus marinus]|uniref:metal ABC transporter ATP-binding protein n=1 Tax=Prochlorococcus marinus TaxID=1219 RepID=UPI0022B5D6FF|nr:metal ABC transporter ATP-binding protein [Prochlorococcus marinus]
MKDLFGTSPKGDFYRIEAEEICVDYNGTLALYDASLKLRSSSICGLVGMNGAGKSTLFKALMGFVRPSRGKIRINGLSVAKAQYDQAVAYVPQNEGIDCSFPVSVWDVVMMGRYGAMNFLRIPRESDRRAVIHALERVDLTDFIHTPIGALSGGQRKRAFLARAIAQRASVLLLDEPFSGVDVRTEKLMADLFLQFRQDGRTILISTHDLSHVREFCDLVILINKTVLAYGETSEVFTSENLSKTFGGILPETISGPASTNMFKQ